MKCPNRSKWAPWLLAMALWIGNPLLIERYLILTQSLGYYTVQSDSIGIPILGGYFLAILGFPVWIFVCYKAFRRIPKELVLFPSETDSVKNHHLVSGIFYILTIGAIWGAVGKVGLFFDTLRSEYPDMLMLPIYLAAVSFSWALLWLIFRSCFLSAKKARE